MLNRWCLVESFVTRNLISGTAVEEFLCLFLSPRAFVLQLLPVVYILLLTLNAADEISDNNRQPFSRRMNRTCSPSPVRKNF